MRARRGRRPRGLLPIYRFQLRDHAVVLKTVARSAHQVVLFKPICDSHDTDLLLDAFAHAANPARALWAYRAVDDRVRSAVAKFGWVNQQVLARAVTGPDGQPLPWAYFWFSGMLSSFLDNAPTYLVFFNLAGGDPATLRGLYGDSDRDTPTVLWAMERLCGQAYTSGEALLALCEDKRPAVSERAIRTLARLDAGQGVPKLLACLEDQRARFAIYGLRKALFDMPVAQAVATLRSVSLRKVTVAKEVLRLLGELRSDDAYALLIGLDKPELHRDVRIALCRALWDHLEREETWQVLERAATGPDFVMATRVGDIPAERLTERSDARLAQLLAKVLMRPEPEARRELLAKAPSLPLHDHQRLFLSACLSRLDSRYYDEVQAAMQAVLRRALPVEVAAYQAQLHQTRPNRRALALIVEQLGSAFDRKSKLLLSLGKVTLQVLGSEPHLATLLLRAAAQLAEPDELAQWLERLGDAGHLTLESLAAAEHAVQSMRGDDLEALELRLGNSRHDSLRLLAVRALQAAAVKGQGFTSARRERLARYQNDPALPVSAAAQLVFPPLTEPAASPAASHAASPIT